MLPGHSMNYQNAAPAPLQTYLHAFPRQHGFKPSPVVANVMQQRFKLLRAGRISST